MCSTEIAVWPNGEWCHVDELEPYHSEYELFDVGVCTDEQIHDFVKRYLC